MKYLIIGLGNMGAEYDNTRHNIGFDVIDNLAAKHDCTFKHDTLGDLAAFKLKGRQVYLLKPSTFMNLSGKAVRYWVNKLKIPADHFLVVVDEFQFDIGTYKLQTKGSPGGHNGLKSIQDLMQTSKYPRLRVGIGHDFHKGGQVDYVLGHWKDKQREDIDAIFPKLTEMIHSFVAIGLDRAMTTHNKGGRAKTEKKDE